MSILGDKIRKEAAYVGPSKAERTLWNLALEKAIGVVDANVLDKPAPQCFAPPTGRPMNREQGHIITTDEEEQPLIQFR